MTRSTRPRHLRPSLQAVFCMILCAAMPWATPAAAHDGAHHHTEAAGTKQVKTRRIPDAQVTDDRGHQVRFLGDVLGNRKALVSFIYTSCTTTCPLVGAMVVEVAKQVQRDEPNLAIISISVDPEYDTPARLAEWRRQFDDIPQWTLLTGSKREITALLRAFGAYSANREDHPDILLVGPDGSGEWTRISSFSESEQVAAVIRAVTRTTAK